MPIGGILVTILLTMVINQITSASSDIPTRDNLEGIKVNGVNRLFIDTASNTLYATSTFPQVTVIDLRKDAIINTIASDKPIYTITIDPISNLMYALSSGEIHVIGTNTKSSNANKVLKILKVGNMTTGISVDPRQHYLYVAYINDSKKLIINKISTIGYRSVKNYTLPVSGKCTQQSPANVQVNTNTNDVYVQIPCQIFKLPFQANGNTKGNFTRIANVTGSNYLAANSKTNFIYVTNQGNNTVSIINGNNYKYGTIINGTISLITTPYKIDNIPVGIYPSSIAVNPYNNTIYVAHPFSGDISVIKGTTKLTTWTIGGIPLSIAINTNTNLIYVADSSGTVRIIKGTTGNTVYGISFNVKPRYYGSIDCNVIPNNSTNNSTSFQNLTIHDTFYYRSDKGTQFNCIAQRSVGKAFDHWEGNLPVNHTMDPISSFLSLPGNSTNTAYTNFLLLKTGNATAVFTDSSFFSDRYGNYISVAAVISCIIFAAIYSKAKISKQDDDSDILTIDATIIAGVLILLSVQGLAFKQTQIAIITADIVFPFAFSIIAGLARKSVYAKTFAIVGCVNFMLSIILVIIISFRSRI